MKFQKPLNDIFQNLSHVKILRVLVNSELDLTGRQIAALAGLSPMGAKKALDHLGELGLHHLGELRDLHLIRLQARRVWAIWRPSCSRCASSGRGASCAA